MEKFLKNKKKGKIFILLLLFFNQFLFNGYASNNKIDLVRSEKNNFKRKSHTTFNNLLAGKNKRSNQILKKNKKKLMRKNEIRRIFKRDFPLKNEIDAFLEEKFPKNNFERE